MVQIFMESLKDQGFRTMIKNEFLKYTMPVLPISLTAMPKACLPT
jgi:hypothetical protein